VKGRTAYQDFLTLWKDADPDVPDILARAWPLSGYSFHTLLEIDSDTPPKQRFLFQPLESCCPTPFVGVMAPCPEEFIHPSVQMISLATD
jgi:hypothetical protein